MLKRCLIFYKRVLAVFIFSVIILNSILAKGTLFTDKTVNAEEIDAANTEGYVTKEENITTQTKNPLMESQNTENSVTTGSAITVKASGLFITEIYYNNISVESVNQSDTKDPMEYIELYNSTDENIYFKDNYTISCASGSAIAFKELSVTGLSGEEVVIPKNSAALFWISRQDFSNNETPTEEDFRNAHNMNTEVPIYAVVGLDGLSSSGGEFDLQDKLGKSVSNYQYTDADIDVNKSIHLKVSSSGSTMSAYKQKAAPSPGEIEEEQLLYDKEIEPDIIPPSLTCEDILKKIQLGDTLTISMTSDEELQSAEISYGMVTNGAIGEWINVSMNYMGEANELYSYQGAIKPDQLGDYALWISGMDLAGNATELPANGSGFSLTVVIKDTGKAPILTCLEDTKTSVDEGEDLNIQYSYEDDMGVQKISIYYKTSSASDYKCIETTSFRIAGKYFAKIPADELLGQDYVDYYLEGVNLYRSAKTEVKRITVNKIDDFTGIRTNLTEGESLSGNVLVTAKDKLDKNTISIAIDGTKMKQVNLLEKGAFFTYSFTGNDSYFKNAVSVGDSILTYIAKWSNVMSSKAVFVDQAYFTYREDGSCVVTISLWAGTQGSAFEIGNDKNNDDYKATGFHLVLTDGTILDPDNGIDPKVTYKMGDSKGMYERLDIHYTVPAEKVDALGYIWDTTLEKDGLHEVTIQSANDSKKLQVRVDNTAPQIITNIKKNEQINNLCTAEFSFNDDTGINENTLEVYLNGRILKSPYTFRGSELAEGNNNLVVKVMDSNGNQGIQTTSFTYHNGKLVVTGMMQTGGKKDSIRLKAVLGDSISDNTKVSFNQGKRLEIGDEISVWQGTGDKTGSSVPGELETVVSESGEYPYQIYEIQAEGDPSDILQVKINAEASYNKPIQLYVYNVSHDSWEILNTTVEDGLHKAEFTLENHIQNGTAKVLVQARGTETTPNTENVEAKTVKNDYQWDGTGIPEQYDFSFAWITDTQYYTESWPDTFTTMNQWIVSERKNQKIKYVMHTGDLVDEFEQTYQWECADKNMKYFEEINLPYGVLAGNHDVAAGNELYENYLKYFGESRFKDSSVYGGFYKNNLGHYDLLTIDGEELIIVYMGWDIYTKEVEWMNKVLTQYSDRKAIICLHRYINEKGALDYTGELVQEKVVAKNSNVFAVLNGHYHGAAINITAFDDDYDGVKERKVYQICTDYQSGEKGGNGYVKMLYFDLANDKIYMNSYSEDLKDFNYFDAGKLSSYDAGIVAANQDIYELNVDFLRVPLSLTTTFMDAALFTNKTIGTGISSNGVAEIEWTGLTKDIQYGWYTVMKNSENLLIRGDVSEFTFLPSEESEPTPSPEPTTKPEPTKKPEPTQKPNNNSPVIEKEDPIFTIPTGLGAVYGDTLANIQLPTDFTFEDPVTTTVGNAGVKNFKVTFTPSDTTKYNTIKGIEISVTVYKAEQIFKAPIATFYTKIYGDSSFSVKGKVTGDGKLTYQSKDVKVAEVDNNGIVTIKGCGKTVITLKTAETANYKSTAESIIILVNPQKVTLTKVGWTNADTIQMTWKRDVKATGYEITYATNNKFTKGKKTINVKNNKINSKDINNLTKEKTYYIKVRAYKTVKGKKIYGAYSVLVRA